MPRRRDRAGLPAYRATPTDERMAATRSAIIDASIHAFRVNGYSATKIESVAALAGISPRTLYRYFGSKSELFAATIAEAAIKFVEQLFIDVLDRYDLSSNTDEEKNNDKTQRGIINPKIVLIQSFS